MPYVILEAIAAEVPVISTHVGGIPEIFGEWSDKFLVQPKNSQQLAEKISYFTNNLETVRAATKEVRQKISTEFSLKKMVKKTKEIYF